MALEAPILSVDTTSTEGVGTYTLDGPASPGGGLRTLANAVAMGHLANGDQVEYTVRDKTTEGAGLLFEEVLGTVGSDGATLTRDEIISNHNGDTNPVSWPSGGSRTVQVSLNAANVCRVANNLSELDANTACDNIGAARLNKTNTFTLAQVISASPTVYLDLQRGPDTWRLRPLSGPKFVLQDFTNSKDILTFPGGGSGNIDVLSGYTLRSGAGTKYDAFPTGMDFLSGTVPTGWTRQNETQSRLIRMAKSGDTLGATGGGDDPFDGSWATSLYTLSISEIPAHQHTVFHTTGVADANGDGATIVTGRVLNVTGGDDQLTTATGGGGSHAHPIPTPYYRIWARITKD